MAQKNRTKMSWLFQIPHGWIKLIIIFVVWYFVFEIGLTMFDVDIAAMIWIPLHFMITPILGLIVSVLSVYIAIKRKEVFPIAASICCAFVIVSISFIGMSGSTIILDAFGVSFN